MSGNRVQTDTLVFTRHAEDPQTHRLFKLMYQHERAKSIVFDPLDEFHEDPQ